MPNHDTMTQQPTLLKPIPRRPKPVESLPLIDEDGCDKGQVQLKKEMIAICQEVIDMLSILAKKEHAFRAFQQQLLSATKQEGWSITEPVEIDVAASASSSTAQAGGDGVLLETSSTPEEARIQIEVPSSPQEHLAALNALNEKINDLRRYQTDLPESVTNVLYDLQVQVVRSIQVVKKDIAAAEQQVYKAQVVEQRKVTQCVDSTDVFAEQKKQLDESVRLERRYSF